MCQQIQNGKCLATILAGMLWQEGRLKKPVLLHIGHVQIPGQQIRPVFRRFRVVIVATVEDASALAAKVSGGRLQLAVRRAVGRLHGTGACSTITRTWAVTPTSMHSGSASGA